MAIDPNISLERLKELMTYDPETGQFTRNFGIKGMAKGAVCGVKTRGYIVISVDYKKVFAHRLAWFYMTGEWPKGDIDHKNRKRDDNRWENLREASRSQNLANNNKTGVCFDWERMLWSAKVTKNRKTYNIGRFKSFDEAVAAVKAKKQELFGEFA